MLAAGAALGEGEEMSLSAVVKMVEAAEMGEATHALVHKASGGLNRLSEHQKKKFDKKVAGSRDRDQGSGAQSSSQGKCGFCGRNQHPREQCPAKEAECRRCKLTGHFEAKCRKPQGYKPKPKVAEVKAVEAKDGGEVQEASLNPLVEDFFGDCMRLSAVEP